MDPLFLAQALGILLGVPTALWIIHHRKIRQIRRRLRLRFWQKAARSCGLHVVEMGPPLRARAGPVEVRIDAVQGKHQEIQITIVVLGPPDFDKVRIHPATTMHPHPDHRVPKIEIGDARFDRAFSLEGPGGLVLALIDEPTRQLLLSLNARGRLEISHGEIRAAIFSRMLSDVLPSLVEVGRRFAQPRDILRRLTENAHSDPEPGVRLQNLLMLVHEHPGNPVTVKALHTACSDPSPEIRLRAAKSLGAEGHDVLLGMAESLEDDTVSAEAVSILGRELSFERTRAILDHALDGSHPKTARACLEVLRLQGASPGQLSLAGSEAGQLSLAQDEAGQLSLATDQAGQLSLPPES